MMTEEKKGDKTPPSGSGKSKEGEEDKTPQKKEVSPSVPISRFNEVNKELKALKREKDEQETKKLEEQKKFQQLSEKQKEEIITLKKEIENNKKFVYFSDHAIQAKVVSVRDAFKLADIDQIEIDSDGKVTGVEKVIKDLQEKKPYLFKEKEGAIGSPSSPPGDIGAGERRTKDGKRFYKEEEFDDKKFYKEHEEDIAQAYKEGRVELRKGPRPIIG